MVASSIRELGRFRKSVVEVLDEPRRYCRSTSNKRGVDPLVGLKGGGAGGACDHHTMRCNPAQLVDGSCSQFGSNVLEQVDRDDSVEGPIGEWQSGDVTEDPRRHVLARQQRAVVVEICIERHHGPPRSQQRFNSSTAAAHVEKSTWSGIGKSVEHWSETDELVHLPGAQHSLTDAGER